MNRIHYHLYVGGFTRTALTIGEIQANYDDLKARYGLKGETVVISKMIDCLRVSERRGVVA